jgi:acid stress chaperone HdeB
MSMRVLCATVLAAALLTAGSAGSQVVDLSTITCKDFFEGPKERASYILTWLNAYYRDDESPPVIDFDKMKADGEKLSAYCQKNPSVGIITAADKVLDK